MKAKFEEAIFNIKEHFIRFKGKITTGETYDRAEALEGDVSYELERLMQSYNNAKITITERPELKYEE